MTAAPPVSTPTPLPGRFPYELPGDFRGRPAGLIILTGLDTTYNATHRLIWDSFCNNRKSDRVPLVFAVRAADYEYPKAKPLRTMYDWYVPKGILKRKWIGKHMRDIPSVVVNFFDLDWDDPLWEERQMECATRLQIIRTSLHGRSTRIVVVLVQKNAPLPPGEDSVAADRASSFCTVCNLSSNSLFVLPHTGQLYGYTIRLENAFYELSQSYYSAEIRKIKTNRELLSKTTHGLLFIRHQFKLGFYHEMKQDSPTALKHYKQAYGLILESLSQGNHNLEMKTVAGFCNYKICALSFLHNAPLDAISQLRKHVDFFKTQVGPPELAFEHSAWMSMQFHAFGDLFDAAIHAGLTPVQTQHPGFYYQQAALHARTRKQLSQSLASSPSSAGLTTLLESSGGPNAPSFSTEAILEELDKVEFFGQRPWKTAVSGGDPGEVEKEKSGIRSLLRLEQTVEHSVPIINLFTSAVAQFKKYKCPRMKLRLMVLMAEEYYRSKQCEKALVIYNHVVGDYRAERWFSALRIILQTSLKCAYIVADVKTYVTAALELMGGNAIVTSPEERTRVQVNLLKVLSGTPPDPEPGCTALDQPTLDSTGHRWRHLHQDDHLKKFTIQMDTLKSFVECKAQFSSPESRSSEPVKIKVFVRVMCEFPIRFSKLSINFNLEEYNEKCVLTDDMDSTPHKEGSTSPPPPAGPGDLFLCPGVLKEFEFSFPASDSHAHSNLEVQSVVVHLGQPFLCAILQWPVAAPVEDTHSKHSILPRRLFSSDGTVSQPLPWEYIRNRPSTRILPRQSLVSLKSDHTGPSLKGEFMRTKVELTNGDGACVRELVLSVHASLEGLDTAVQVRLIKGSDMLSDDVSQEDLQLVDSENSLPIEKLEVEEKREFALLTCAPKTGTMIITLKIAYVSVETTNEETDGNLVKDGASRGQSEEVKQFSVPVVEPFQVKTTVTPLRGPLEDDKASKYFEHTLPRLESQTIETGKLPSTVAVVEGEPFQAYAELRNGSSVPLCILSTSIQLADGFSASRGLPLISTYDNDVLYEGESGGECQCFVASKTEDSSSARSLGKYSVTWRREVSSGPIPASSVSLFDLSSVAVEVLPLYVEMAVPSRGVLRQPLSVLYTLHNRTELVQECETRLEPTDTFVFSGSKQASFRILPLTTQTLAYTFVPLLSGYLTLPELKLNMKRYPGVMAAEVKSMLPGRVFVRPSDVYLE